MASNNCESFLPLGSIVESPNPFLIAHLARRKMAQQSARDDYNLRLLVGHANTIDHLEVVISRAQRDRLDGLSKYNRDTSDSVSTQSIQSTNVSVSDHPTQSYDQAPHSEPSHPASTVIQVLSVFEDEEEESDSGSSDDDKGWESDDEGFDIGLQETTKYRISQPYIATSIGVKPPSSQQVTVTETEICD